MPRHELDGALALQGAQVFLGGIGRTESERTGDLGTRRGHAVFADALLDEPQDLALARGKVRHGDTCMDKQLLCVYTAEGGGRQGGSQ
jgi:hypothetical protein